MARILFFDIETAGVNALKSDLGFVILFGYKFSDESAAHVLQIDRASLKKFSDYRLLQQAATIIERADIVVAHYGSVFDRRFIQGRLLINRLPPIPPTKMRDTKFIASSNANFSSNRLKNLAKTLGLKNRKTENNWPTAWFKVMQGDMKALNRMALYCKHDVLALEELYYRLRPFDNPHPRLVQGREQCGVCGAPIHYRGFSLAGEFRYRRFQCTKCGKWGRSRNREKE